MIDMHNIEFCPGTLQQGFNTYSRKCINEMFNGIRISHILDFSLTQEEGTSMFVENVGKFSISGVQQKFSLLIENKKLKLTEKGGQYILKPIPTALLQNIKETPANEHLTMQIAYQVFKINVAKNALIFFKDGQPAYITKRFDVKEDNSRCLKEDFASMAGYTEQTKGKHYKYAGSYVDMAAIIDVHFAAPVVNKERLFKLIVFNYLFNNGDAHLKNFSRLDCSNDGNANLSPAYDLLNTALLNRSDTYVALENGLYEEDMEHPSYARYGCYGYDNFLVFGAKLGLLPIRVERILNNLLGNQEKVNTLIDNSFLSAAAKRLYKEDYNQRYAMLSRKLKEV
jgi:serine/threonine-protein kinase HipA